MAVHDSILGVIGNTPVVRLQRLAPDGVEIYVKLEASNPGGSVKDRLALGVIEAAERDGSLRPGQMVIEATSGNTGIGLAVVCAQRGYPLVVVMAENFSLERRKLMRFLGAQVVLTPASAKGSGMLNKARELADAHDAFLCRQFDNEANADIHSRTTAREILEDFPGNTLYAWVTGFGTGGTLKGVARKLKANSPATRVVVCEPDNAPLLGSQVPQARDASGHPSESHPVARPHLVQGWSPDFIPSLVEEAVDAGLIDQIVPVGGVESLRLARELATKEGILTGISGGATLAGALGVAREAPAGSRILVMLPDTAERYLSTPLFEHVGEDMDAQEVLLSRSTPGYRFDRPATSPRKKDAPTTTPLDEQALAYVRDVTQDRSQPVVMFALEWCEFCWSARKLFDRLQIPYRSVDLDSVAYQEGGRGGKIRAVLKAQTGSPTIPQIYIGGTHVGGCTDLFDGFKAGSVQGMLASSGVDHQGLQGLDPYTLLPGWLHVRT